MLIDATSFDPSWSAAVESRKAVLWLGPSFGQVDQLQKLRALLLRNWAAIFIDAVGLEVTRFIERADSTSLVVRVFQGDAGPDHLPPNRLPIYCLRGLAGRTGPGDVSDPAALMVRYEMLKRNPVDCEIFLLGIDTSDDLAGIAEAISVAPDFKRLVIVDDHSLPLESLAQRVERLIRWRGKPLDLIDALNAVGGHEVSSDETILVRTPPSGTRAVDLGPAIDRSHPITALFELISARNIRVERRTTEEDVKAFLAAPDATWLPYAAGIPYPRHRDYEKSLLTTLKKFAREGPSASLTAWLPAEDGAGATTVLHQLCFDIAREGYPALLARPDVQAFDFSQLAGWMTKASDLFAAQGVPIDTPWVIAFDAVYTSLNWDFIAGLCNGLKKLMRSVVVLAVRPEVTGPSEGQPAALGTNRTLGKVLSSTVSADEGVAIGDHLGKFLPAFMRRTKAEWSAFIDDALRTTIEGRRSLFWVALRFWLLRLPGVEDSLRRWLATKFDLAGKEPGAYAGLLLVAALAKYRLVGPLTLLADESAKALREIAKDTSNSLGLRLVYHGNSRAVTYAHPLIAEELLRIGQANDSALAAVGKTACLNLLDLELHLFEQLISRPEAGSPACIHLMEELVTTALRVDPRESPRNFQVRDRIVGILEKAPKSLWDTSQIFNHHVAKARRHLAMAPPDSRWTLSARREQLTLAESHLQDALQHIHVDDDDRRESPLNLWVSLALTYDARARVEEEDGASKVAGEYKVKADGAYRTAQHVDPDNSYVLENFARFKLRLAKNEPPGVTRTTLVVDAITLLESERAADETGYREEPIMVELATAYSLLEEAGGQQLLGRLAAQGSEAALVALAKLALKDVADAVAPDDLYREAEELLRRVKAADVTWRSRVLYYRVVSQRTRYDFGRRLEILRELDADQDFIWPQQLRLEYGILLFQVGDLVHRKKGTDVFKRLRDELPDRSGSVRVPDELKFLADPRSAFRLPLKTHIVVKNVSDVGKSSYGTPEGWGNIDVAFRTYRFDRDRIRPRDELDCLIQFTNFGPQAVPTTAV